MSNRWMQYVADDDSNGKDVVPVHFTIPRRLVRLMVGVSKLRIDEQEGYSHTQLLFVRCFIVSG